jgi:LacI family transcriptional regulator
MSVVIDNYKAGYDATAHLIEQGCKKIIHLGGNLLRNVYSERFRGYKQALHDNGIEYNQKHVFICDLTGQAGREIMKKVFKTDLQPDGIFAANDTSAVAAILEIQEAGLRVPDDIAVVGFNNEPISQVIHPNLTTIDYPAKEIGEIAATVLIEKISNSQSVNYSTIVLKHSLIIRQSSLRNN